MVLDSALLNTQHYKVRVKGKVEQSRKWSSTPLHLDVVAIQKGAFGSPSTKGDNFTFFYMGIEFGFEKYAMQIMKRRKRETAEEIELPNQENIRLFGEKENYKYLGILEADTFKQGLKNKKSVTHKNKKTSRNQIKGINTLTAFL